MSKGFDLLASAVDVILFPHYADGVCPAYASHYSQRFIDDWLRQNPSVALWKIFLVLANLDGVCAHLAHIHKHLELSRLAFCFDYAHCSCKPPFCWVHPRPERARMQRISRLRKLRPRRSRCSQCCCQARRQGRRCARGSRKTGTASGATNIERFR